MIDNHIYYGNKLQIEKVVWKRCVDLNDRQLRKIQTGLSGESKIVPREDGFDISVASEIMAIVCLSENIEELKQRLGNIIIGYNKKEVLFDRDPRIAGTTKWNYKKLIDLAIDGITSFTTSPLRISTYLSIPTFFALVVYFIYVIVKCVTQHIAIQAFQAIILLVLFFAGIQIMLFGIMGEYLGRIFNETKNRPLYFIKEYDGIREENEK